MALMGKDFTNANVKGEEIDIPVVPPGFKPLTSFILKKVHSCVSANYCASEQPDVSNNHDIFNNAAVLLRHLRHKPWINYNQFGDNLNDESEFEQLNKNNTDSSSLPERIAHTQSDNSNCKRDMGMCQPEGSCRPVLDDAPEFYPSEEEFKDTLNYIANIRSKAEAYGICRIIPPPSWNPPCLLKDKFMWENSKFDTRIQRIDKLQNREVMQKPSMFYKNTAKKSKKRLKIAAQSKNMDLPPELNEHWDHSYSERFGFEIGTQFTLEKFQKYADAFKENYFKSKVCHSVPMNAGCTSKSARELSVEDIEGEYWRIVEKPTGKIEVLYGADIETGKFGSGFPKSEYFTASSDADIQYVESGWNLNNTSRLKNSLLSFESGDISGVQVPWLYIGMCFSSFCWHVEDHHLYSLNYMHWGAPKIWYGVPGEDALKLEAAMKKHLPNLFEEQPDLLHKLVTQLSPSILKSEGVSVYRCVQKAREFVLTFPRAYHSGFNCGFNCAEAVNLAPVDWLPHGQTAVELYCIQGRRTSISHDKLLLGASREAVRALWELTLLRKDTFDNQRWKEYCGKNGILSKALKTRVEMEHARRERLNSCRCSKMDKGFDSVKERECVICSYDLHLSACGCECFADKYSCLVHAKQLCACPWSSRFFLFRYDLDELDMLVEALEGKLSLIHKWALSDLGLSLSSIVNKGRSLEPSLSSGVELNKQAASTNISSVEKGHDIVDNEFTSRLASNLDVLKGQIVSESNNDSSSVCSIRASDDDLVHENEMEVEMLQKEKFYRTDMFESHIASPRGNTVTRVLPVCELPHVASRHVHELDVLMPTTTDSDPFLTNSELLDAPHHGVILISDDDDGKNSSRGFIEDPLRVDEMTIVENDSKNPALGVTVDGPVASKKTRRIEWCGTSDASRVKNGFQEDDHTLVEKQFTLPGGSQSSCLCYMHTAKVSDSENSTQAKHKELQEVSYVKSVFEEKSDKIDQCKGPGMPKSVDRVNYKVEPLEMGTVVPGKLWSTCQAIFPKGFKSRVCYLSVIDPTEMCYYVNEVLDAGLHRPLFMVKMEEYPCKTFVHTSATICWNMVQERVNLEMRRQYSMGRIGLPLSQPPEPLDGLKMFGFFSPEIIKAIEAMDPNHLCLDYWVAKAKDEISVGSELGRNLGYLIRSMETAAKYACIEKHLVETDTVLNGLFGKATLAELQMIHRLLTSDMGDTDRQMAVECLVEELHARTSLFHV